MGNIILTRKTETSDKVWIKEVMLKSWNSEIVIASKPFNTLQLPGFIAEIENKPVGILTYNIEDGRCEIVSLNSTVEKKGVGTMLINKIKQFAQEEKYKSVWLVTSNDNIDALRFYQKRGFRITKIYPDAIEEARKLKPQIPEIGDYGIPMKDAFELEFNLS